MTMNDTSNKQTITEKLKSLNYNGIPEQLYNSLQEVLVYGIKTHTLRVSIINSLSAELMEEIIQLEHCATPTFIEHLQSLEQDEAWLKLT